MKFLNLGILAHVDAGKTSLTERLLYAAGVIDEIGSVDAGNTQTDSLALERKRGITIKSAVASFEVNGITINLLDTPGHPDFIAEVERVLSVLDGAILVISAVEGVQAQTRILMRALQRLHIPTLIFVNKIDRRSARYGGLLDEIKERLTPDIVPMGVVHGLGSSEARFAPTTKPVNNPSHPVFFGSAITGAGVDEVLEGITSLLPSERSADKGRVSGRVFKIERGLSGEKIAYARMFSGTIRVRELLDFGDGNEGRLTAISVFRQGDAVQRPSLAAGEIGKLWGLGSIKIGDTIGSASNEQGHYFAPPTLETVVMPTDMSNKGRLHVALDQLAEQDPLINLRQDDIRQELYLSLYGEVQKEVIQDTLLAEFGIVVAFRSSTTICVERPTTTGEAVEVGKSGDPFLATVGLRVEPMQKDGISFRIGDEALGRMPLAFYKAIEDSVVETLGQGLHGWQVTGCMVTLTHAGYFPRQSHAHARFDKSMSSTGADFRGLTPLVLMKALSHAGSIVCEPVHHFVLEIPENALSTLLPILTKMEAITRNIDMRNDARLLEGDIPAASVHDLQQQLPSLTSGEGVLEYAFSHYEPVRGQPPMRPRTDFNPLDRKEYMLHITKRN